MNKKRYICANCDFVFDEEIGFEIYPITCPNCGSNACDEKYIYYKEFEKTCGK